MRFPSRFARLVWKAVTYLFLIAFSSILGAHSGSFIGHALGALLGEPDWWLAQGRCAGWTLFVLVTVIGAPLGFVYFYPRAQHQGGNQRTPSHVRREWTKPTEGQRTVGGIKALLIAPLAGAFIGLIAGGMLGGYLIALYFFVALSPVGPGGWWPILPLNFHSIGDGFGTTDAVILIPWLIVMGTFSVLGILLGLSGVISLGGTRYQMFRSSKD